MTTTILSARWIVSGVNNDNNVEIHENAGLVFKNDKILEVNSIDKIKSKYPNAKIKNYFILKTLIFKYYLFLATIHTCELRQLLLKNL